jgi:hypothetical protein
MQVPPGERSSRKQPVSDLKHQKEKRSMNYFAGLDVSVKNTSICIVDEMGKVVREVKVASEVITGRPAQKKVPPIRRFLIF